MNIFRERFRHKGVACIVMLGVLMTAQQSLAQSDLENILKQANKINVTGYAQPLADLFGANIHSGYYHSAAISKAGLFLRLDVIGMGSPVSDDHKTYDLTLPQSFAQRTMKAPTAFGPKATLVTDPQTGFQYKPSDGVIDASMFPLAVPQLTIGNVFGTQAVVRFIATPTLKGNSFPKSTLWGAGIRHSISQYFENPAIDIAVSGFYSQYTMGDIIDLNGYSAGAQVSKDLSPLVIYGGAAWEKSTMNIAYTPEGAGNPAVDVDLEGDNTFRFTAGAALEIGPLKFFTDANFGAVTAFSGGLGLGTW